MHVSKELMLRAKEVLTFVRSARNGMATREEMNAAGHYGEPVIFLEARGWLRRSTAGGTTIYDSNTNNNQKQVEQ